ncbi:MAG: protein-L-isoaspartate O-methyltransferase [Granulosicoccus sp.]
MDFQAARNNMIEQQVRPWDVLDQRVLDVLALVPREEFVDASQRGIAYSDFPLPIGHGQHLLKPILDGRLLQALLLKVTDSVLEIGTGSGYLTACMARLAGHCESLEIIPELAEAARIQLTSQGIANITLHNQDAATDWDMRDAYDAIAFSGAVESVPDNYHRRLKPGGRLFAVIGSPKNPTMEAVLITRVHDEEWSTESLFETRVDALVNFSSDKPEFIF